jgi:hypothetical protein
MEFEDIYKYVGYFMVGLVVLWLGLKSLRFQYKCVGGVCNWLKPKKQNAAVGAAPLGPSGAGPSGAGPEAVPEARQTTIF